MPSSDLGRFVWLLDRAWRLGYGRPPTLPEMIADLRKVVPGMGHGELLTRLRHAAQEDNHEAEMDATVLREVRRLADCGRSR